MMMTPIWSESIDPILAAGCPLEDVGVRNWGLRKEEALLALQSLRELGVAVLGGDVYSVFHGQIELSYDNWHCDRRAGENEAEFLDRSINKALDYISNYSATDAIFAIVPLV